MYTDNDAYIYRDTCMYIDIHTHNTNHLHTDVYFVASDYKTTYGAWRLNYVDRY